DVSVLVTPQRAHEQVRLRASVASAHDVAKVGPVEAGDVFVGIAKLELMDDVVPHTLRGARSERGNGAVGKMDPQAAQLAVFRAELVAPLRDAVRFVNGEERDRHALQPVERVRARQALRRKIQEAVLARARFAYHLSLLARRERTVQQSRWNSHLPKLGHLILHQDRKSTRLNSS